MSGLDCGTKMVSSLLSFVFLRVVWSCSHDHSHHADLTHLKANPPPACPPSTPGAGLGNCSLPTPADPAFTDICNPGATGFVFV